MAFSALKSERKASQTEATDLHFDVLLHMFKFLDKKTLGRCAKVCRSWRVVAYQPTLWSACLFEIPATGLCEEAALSLKSRVVTAVSVKQNWLSIMPTNSPKNRYPYDWYYDTNPSFFHTRYKIEESLKHKFLLCEDQLTPILRCCTETLRVEILVVMDSPLQFNMATKFTGLRKLCLIDPDIDIEAFVGILGSMENLDQLYINSKNRYVESCGIFQKKDKRRFNCFNVLQDVVRSKQSLRTFELVSLNWSISYVPPPVLRFGNTAQLEKLVLTDTIDVCDHLLAQVSQKLPSLKHLRLDKLQAGNPTNLQACFPALQSLTTGVQVRTDPKLIANILQNSPNLTALDLSEGFNKPKDDNYSSERFAVALRLIGLCPNLKFVSVSGCGNVGNQAVLALLTDLPHLEVLIALGTTSTDGLLEEDKPEQGSNHLISLLVEDNPSWLDQLPSLSYKSIAGHVYMKSADNITWRQVHRGSHHWKKAHGWNYFHLPDEYDFTSRYETPGTAVQLSIQKGLR